MKPCPRPLIPSPHQLSLLPALTRPEHLSAEELRDAVALLATLLLEAGGCVRLEPTDDRD